MSATIVGGVAAGTTSFPLVAAPTSLRRGSVPQRWTPAAISTEAHESTPTFTPDGRTLFFVRSDQNFAKSQIMQSNCTSEGWSKAVLAPFAKTLPVVESDPFVTPDGRRIFFISTRPSQDDPHPKDFDIYSADRLPDGQWGEPQRLPEPVNTDGEEFFPRVDRAGNLYFHSDRPGGLGLGDIYIATRDEAGHWQVRNAGSSINTASNEIEADISEDGRELIVTAERPAPAHLFRYVLRSGRWVQTGRIPAKTDVYQVGPLLSPTGDRLLFAQKEGDRSGELFLSDLQPRPNRSWPPRCA